MQRNDKNRFITILIIYYGVLQLTHLISLIRAGFILISEGRVTFPASPPPQGWSNQALYFLVGMSIFDTSNIFLTFIFVYAYITVKKWTDWLGLINLTAMISSAIFFALGTIPSGAWFNHPFEYLIITILFLPIFVLYFLFIYHITKAKF